MYTQPKRWPGLPIYFLTETVRLHAIGCGGGNETLQPQDVRNSGAPSRLISRCIPDQSINWLYYNNAVLLCPPECSRLGGSNALTLHRPPPLITNPFRHAITHLAPLWELHVYCTLHYTNHDVTTGWGEQTSWYAPRNELTLHGWWTHWRPIIRNKCRQGSVDREVARIHNHKNAKYINRGVKTYNYKIRPLLCANSFDMFNIETLRGHGKRLSNDFLHSPPSPATPHTIKLEPSVT